jgi:DnaK suppressor protein
LTPRQLSEFRRRLENELAAIYRSVHGEVRQEMAPVPRLVDEERAGDEADESQRTQTRDLLLSLAESDARRAQLIEEALRRITRGEYGVCVECGNPIGLGRLKLIPWTARCLEDQERAEAEARSRAPTL